MGYTTDFIGNFAVKENVDDDFIEYINNFSKSRRLKRNPDIIKTIYPFWQLMCFDGKLGTEGEYFVNTVNMGQVYDDSIIDYNSPASTQPGLWCQWIIKKENGKCYLEWDGGEKFYSYVDWLNYLINNFFGPKHYHLTGCILAIGESEADAKYIIINNNICYVYDYENDLDILLNKFDNKELKEQIKNVYKDPVDIENNYWNYWE